MIELLGGRMWVESKPGAGSCFYFKISLAREEKEENFQKK